MGTLLPMSSQPPTNGDWVTQVVNLVERTVGAVRDKTTRPVSGVARALVWGLLAAVLGSVALVLAVIAADRALVIVTGHRAYLAHLIVGIILCLGGLVCMRKRRAPEGS
jgi:predicted phage tail protein